MTNIMIVEDTRSAMRIIGRGCRRRKGRWDLICGDGQACTRRYRRRPHLVRDAVDAAARRDGKQFHHDAASHLDEDAALGAGEGQGRHRKPSLYAGAGTDGSDDPGCDVDGGWMSGDGDSWCLADADDDDDPRCSDDRCQCYGGDDVCKGSRCRDDGPDADVRIDRDGGGDRARDDDDDGDSDVGASRSISVILARRWTKNGHINITPGDTTRRRMRRATLTPTLYGTAVANGCQKDVTNGGIDAWPGTKANTMPLHQLSGSTCVARHTMAGDIGKCQKEDMGTAVDTRG